MSQAQSDDWLEGALIEVDAQNLEIRHESIQVDIEIPDDDHDGEPPAVA